MTANAVNPLATARDLEAAGFERNQAEALAEAVHRTGGADRDALATKADLDALEGKLEGKLYRALWIQGGAVIAILTALRFFPV